MKSKRLTAAQAERQGARNRAGEYEKCNPCEVCGKSAGAEYCSDPRCNTFNGKGLVLCARCAPWVAVLTDLEYGRLFGVCGQCRHLESAHGDHCCTQCSCGYSAAYLKSFPLPIGPRSMTRRRTPVTE